MGKTPVEFPLGLFPELYAVAIAPSGSEPIPYAPPLQGIHGLGEAQHARLRLFDLQQGEQIFYKWSFEGQAGARAGVFQHQIEGIRPVLDRDVSGVQTQLGGVAVFACRLRVALLRFREALPVQLSAGRQPILQLCAVTGRNLDVAGENRAGDCLLRLRGNELEG